MKLSVVDQSPVSAGSTPADALRNTIELARLVERLGYERYWIAEHHAISSLASPAPEILITRVAAETSTIRVGSGGVMLPHYSALKVAEVFRMLHAMYPDRIDLGIGRAPGGSPLEAFALQRDREHGQSVDDFPAQLVELIAFLNHGFAANHPFSRIKVTPEMPGGPEVWLLGSSPWSAAAAAQFGLPYAFAHFISPVSTRTALEYYRAHVKTSSGSHAGKTILAMGALCAETESEAQRQYASIRLRMRQARTGDRGPIPDPDQALKELEKLGPEGAPDPYRDGGEFPRYVIGDPHQVRSRLSEIAEELRVDELMIVTITYDHRARMRSYELLAEAFELTPRS